MGSWDADDAFAKDLPNVLAPAADTPQRTGRGSANTDRTDLSERYVLYGGPRSYFTEKVRHAMTWYMPGAFQLGSKVTVSYMTKTGPL